MSHPGAANPNLTPEQSAIMVLQQELMTTRQAVQAGAAAHDALKAAHDALNVAAQNALAEKDTQIKHCEERLRNLIFRQHFDLLDSKEIKPDHFRGRATEAFKPWQRKFKAFCNSKRTGFRGALEWAETQASEIFDLTPMRWDEAIAAGPKLQDFLLQVLDENALLLVDKPELEGRGFESWRLLVQQYAPSGGAYELDSMIALMTLHQCKSLHELPGAVAKFERDVGAYEKRTGRAFPAEFKVPAFLRMVPKSHASDMRWRFSQGATDYDSLKQSILTYSQHLRMDGAHARGDNDMHCDALGLVSPDGWEEWISDANPQEINAFYGGLTEGLQSECPDEPVETCSTDSPMDALYRKGKGKGKGKNKGKGTPKGGKDKGKGKGKDGTGKGPKTDEYCSWCHIQGHFMRDCRKRAAGIERMAGPTP